MKIETKFNIGEKVFTIDNQNMKVKDFIISRISTSTSDGRTFIMLYDGDSYLANGYEESKCFHTEADLMTYISSKSDV